MSGHFTAHVGVRNAFQECQSCLKYVLLVMGDAVRKKPLIQQSQILTEGHFFIMHLPADGL